MSLSSMLLAFKSPNSADGNWYICLACDSVLIECKKLRKLNTSKQCKLYKRINVYNQRVNLLRTDSSDFSVAKRP